MGSLENSLGAHIGHGGVLERPEIFFHADGRAEPDIVIDGNRGHGY
jgi:hypothetical protein